MEQRSEIRFGLLETGIGNNLLSLSEQTNVSPTNFTEMRKQFPEAHKVGGGLFLGAWQSSPKLTSSHLSVLQSLVLRVANCFQKRCLNGGPTPFVLSGKGP